MKTSTSHCPYKEKSYRFLSSTEKISAYETSLRQGSCCFCGAPGYSAETLCNCIESKRIPYNSTLEENMCRRRRRSGRQDSPQRSKKDLVALYPEFFVLYEIVYLYIGKKHGLPDPNDGRVYWDDLYPSIDFIVQRALHDLNDVVF